MASNVENVSIWWVMIFINITSTYNLSGYHHDFKKCTSTFEKLCFYESQQLAKNVHMADRIPISGVYLVLYTPNDLLPWFHCALFCKTTSNLGSIWGTAIPRQQYKLAQRWPHVDTIVPTLGYRWANIHYCLGYICIKIYHKKPVDDSAPWSNLIVHYTSSLCVHLQMFAGDLPVVPSRQLRQTPSPSLQIGVGSVALLELQLHAWHVS